MLCYGQTRFIVKPILSPGTLPKQPPSGARSPAHDSIQGRNETHVISSSPRIQKQQSVAAHLAQLGPLPASPARRRDFAPVHVPADGRHRDRLQGFHAGQGDFRKPVGRDEVFPGVFQLLPILADHQKHAGHQSLYHPRHFPAAHRGRAPCATRSAAGATKNSFRFPPTCPISSPRSSCAA